MGTVGDQHHEVSPVKELLITLSERCNSEDLRDKDQFDAHRSLLRAAIYSTNGAEDKIAAIAETQGQLAAFMVQQSIREPARLAEAFSKVHICPFKRDPNGNLIDPPWEAYTRKALEEVKPPEQEESFTFGLPKLPKLLEWRGRESVKVGASMVKWILIPLALWYMMGRNNNELKKELRVDRAMDLVSVLQSTGLLDEDAVPPYEAAPEAN